MPHVLYTQSTMARHKTSTVASPHDRLVAGRTWSITLGISAFLLTVMYTAAFVHYGVPHLENPEGAVAELSYGERI